MALTLSLCGCGGKARDNAKTRSDAPATETPSRSETPNSGDGDETPESGDSDETPNSGDDGETPKPDGNGGTPNSDGGETSKKENPTPVVIRSSAEIKTYNIVLVMDASGSMEKTDSRHSATNAACMFLDSLYASASEEGDERLFGVKDVNLSVLSYNDKVAKPASETLLSLDTAGNVAELKKYIWRINFEQGSSDNALGDALEKAMNMLSDFSRTRGGMTREDTRYLVILATDGFRRGSVNSPDTGHSPGSGASPDTGHSLIPILPLRMEVPASKGPKAIPLSAGNVAVSAVSATGSAENQAPPDFGLTGSGKEKLQNALNLAKEYGSEIFTLGLNMDNGDAQWEEFQRLSEYTKRKASAREEDALSKTGLWGGGVFSDLHAQPSEKVNYHIADSLVKAQWFYIKMAAAMFQSAPDPLNPPIKYETIRSPERGADENFRRFDCDLQGGLSAVIFYALAPGNLSDVKLKGPDPKNPGQMKDYTLSIRNPDEHGWDKKERRIRNDWYEDASASTLTVLNPEQGKWQFYARCKDDNNSSLEGYLVLVNGVDTEVRFLQGTDDESGEHPFNTGEIRVYFTDMNGVPMPQSFYDGLTEKTCVMTGAQFQSKSIPLQLKDDEDGNAMLAGTCEVPAPGSYRTELTMKSSQMDYSASGGSVFFQPRTDRKIIVQKETYPFSPPFLAYPWSEEEKSGTLKLRIVPDSWKVTPKTLATAEASPSRANALLITALEAGDNGTLEFSVTIETDDGASEELTLSYPLEVRTK